MKFTAADADVLHRIMVWRRDVREFRPDPVDESVIDRLQAAMALAPSVGNSRPWRVIRVESPALKAAVRNNFECSNTAAADAYEGQQRDDYRRLVLAGLDTAPLQLAVFTVVDPQEGHGLGRRTMAATLEQSTAMAIHTLWLAARAENIGLGMVSIVDPMGIKQDLAVPEDWCFSAYLCLGHALADETSPLLHRVGWQHNTQSPWGRL